MSHCCDRHAHLRETDPQLHALIERQIEAESTTLKMIASENYASFSVLEASGSILTNKYCEGYPQARYYEGNEIVDQIKDVATGNSGYHQDVPLEAVIIERAELV